tara:strand:- start:552 stop:698 length:147 start_codon:yes stop_codon:yes gene_type:complete
VGEDKTRHVMFLDKAPISKRFGYKQPMSYIEVNENNYSTFRNAKPDFG